MNNTARLVGWLIGLSYVGRWVTMALSVTISAVALLIGDSIALAMAEGKSIYLAPF